MKTLQQMQDEVFEWAKTKGWEPDPDRTFGDEMALLHSEVSEALEAYREIKLEYRAGPEYGWGVQEHIRIVGTEYHGEEPCSQCLTVPKPNDVPSEFADILIRLLHYSKNYGIDLEREYERKMRYNHVRAWRHGGRGL